MKKIIFTVLLLTIVLLTGCGKANETQIRKDFLKDSKNLNSYYLEGVLNLTNNDDNYQYDVEVSYAKDNYYKVVLTNNANNYRQIILRNDDGIFVVTPALNKSFKFQSEWPYNNSQSYLINSVASDLENDEDYGFTMKDEDYIFTTDVNYPNNKEFVKQNITLDKDLNLKKVEVLNENDIPLITFTVTSIDKKATFANNYFDLETISSNLEKEKEDTDRNTNCDSNNCEISERDNTATSENNTDNDVTEESENNTTETTEEKQTISEAVFPLYLPSNTSLANKEVIEINNGERVIMTFSGDKPFILVQETASKEDELTIVPTYGEPYLLVDTVGALTDISYTWTSNGIEYYIVSDVMEIDELLEVARSLNVVSTIKTK